MSAMHAHVMIMLIYTQVQKWYAAVARVIAAILFSATKKLNVFCDLLCVRVRSILLRLLLSQAGRV